MSKRRMPPNLAWPCSRAALADALGTDIDRVDVSWWIDGGGDRDNLLYADWNSRRFPYGEPPISPSKLKVVVRPIQRLHQAKSRRLMHETGLPDLARWVAAAFAGAAVVDRQFWH